MDGNNAYDRQVSRHCILQSSLFQSIDHQFGSIQVHIERNWITIHQYWNRSLITHNFGRSRKCHGRNDDSLARLEFESFDRKMKCSGAGVECNGVSTSYRSRKGFLKLADFWSAGKPAPTQGCDYRLHFLVTQIRAEKWDLSFCFHHYFFTKTAN